MQNQLLILLILTVGIISYQIQLEIDLFRTNKVCTILVNSFDNVNIEVKLPTVPDKQQDQKFYITVVQLNDLSQYIIDIQSQDNKLHRQSLSLIGNNLYQLCIKYNTFRIFDKSKPIYIGFSAIQDFQKLVGRIQIPNELANQTNLKNLYQYATKLNQVSKIIQGHQQKQLIIQDQIVIKDIHKQNRILFLAVIQSLVVLCSGIYQVFALRKFLIQQNLY